MVAYFSIETLLILVIGGIIGFFSSIVLQGRLFKRQDKEKLGPLQILVVVPAAMIGSHIVEWEEEANRMVVVELVGPRAELNKLKAAGKENIMAFIVLGSTHAEPTETYYTVPVQFWFATDIHEVKLADPSKTVKVRLRKLGEK